MQAQQQHVPPPGAATTLPGSAAASLSQPPTPLRRGASLTASQQAARAPGTSAADAAATEQLRSDPQAPMKARRVSCPADSSPTVDALARDGCGAQEGQAQQAGTQHDRRSSLPMAWVHASPAAQAQTGKSLSARPGDVPPMPKPEHSPPLAGVDVFEDACVDGGDQMPLPAAGGPPAALPYSGLQWLHNGLPSQAAMHAAAGAFQAPRPVQPVSSAPPAQHSMQAAAAAAGVRPLRSQPPTSGGLYSSASVSAPFALASSGSMGAITGRGAAHKRVYSETGMLRPPTGPCSNELGRLRALLEDGDVGNPTCHASGQPVLPLQAPRSLSGHQTPVGTAAIDADSAADVGASWPVGGAGAPGMPLSRDTASRSAPMLPHGGQVANSSAALAPFQPGPSSHFLAPQGDMQSLVAEEREPDSVRNSFAQLLFEFAQPDAGNHAAQVPVLRDGAADVGTPARGTAAAVDAFDDFSSGERHAQHVCSDALQPSAGSSGARTKRWSSASVTASPHDGGARYLAMPAHALGTGLGAHLRVEPGCRYLSLCMLGNVPLWQTN